MPKKLSENHIRKMALRWFPDKYDLNRIRVIYDSSDYFRVQYNDILVLDNIPYLIRHNAKEGRFGIEEDIKYWVKRAIDLTENQMKILKLAFFEKFTTSIAGIRFESFRSPKKEARILKLVRDHENFMQGHAVLDSKGNLIRILDYIHGNTLPLFLENIISDHETYFFEQFPGLLDLFIELVRGIKFLHDHGEKHGDIRRDHVLIDCETNKWRWIDFDINYRHRENIFSYDLFGLGNVLIYLAAKGEPLLRDLVEKKSPSMEKLTNEDVNIVFKYRIANLKKVFPYIPDSLNNILLHFSRKANRFYEHTSELLSDLEACRDEI